MAHWDVEFHDDFATEFREFDERVQDALLAASLLLADYGPRLGRPYVDTLKGSRYANMKELRFEASGGQWRAAFAFDPARRAIVLVAGDKAGESPRRFYERLIARADRRYTAHLRVLPSVKGGR